jgi:hypothetical protein
MSDIFEYILENFHSIKDSKVSHTGYPIFQFGIPQSKAKAVAEYGSYYTALFGNGGGNGFYTTQIVFYSEKDEVVNKFNEFILAKPNKKDIETHVNNLKAFLKEHKDCFVDINKNPIKELDYWEARMYYELSEPKRYQEIQQKLENGVCYLIKENNLYTFRIHTRENYGANPALKGYYTKPINTQEDLAKHTKAVNKLFDAGKIEYEVMLTGRTAKACIDNITTENAKLPNQYEYEQICILDNYAKLQKYPIETSQDKNGKHKVTLTTHYGVVNVLVGEKEDNPLLVSYDKNKNIKMDLADFVDKFYYDKTKDKVNELVKKFKAK